MIKHYEVQPNQAQRTALKCDALMGHAVAACNGQGTLTITKDGGGIIARVEGTEVVAWAQLTQRGTITASYSNQWGK